MSMYVSHLSSDPVESVLQYHGIGVTKGVRASLGSTVLSSQPVLFVCECRSSAQHRPDETRRQLAYMLLRGR